MAIAHIAAAPLSSNPSWTLSVPSSTLPRERCTEIRQQRRRRRRRRRLTQDRRLEPHQPHQDQHQHQQQYRPQQHRRLCLSQNDCKHLNQRQRCHRSGRQRLHRHRPKLQYYNHNDKPPQLSGPAPVAVHRHPKRPSCDNTSTSGRPLWLRVLLSVICCLMFAATFPAVRAECPRQCECKWKSGKESVQCWNGNLTALPPFLDAGTQILDLTGNQLASIQADAFKHANLLNLQKLYVAKCRIRSIDRFGFRKVKNLVELDLSHNQLQAVPSHAFDSTPELRELRLSANPITVLSQEAFVNVPQLVKLELTDCRLQSIERGAFDGLEQSLEVLKIDGNRLVTVHAPTFTVLRNLHGLELASNLWNCSCALRALRKWMLREKIRCDIPPVCQQPDRLAARSWDKIELDDFACVPQIAAPLAHVQAIEGENVTIACGVRGVPEPHVNWYLRGRLLANLSGDVQVAVTHGRKVFIARWWPDESNLTIVNADMQDAGVYNCTAANNAGRAEASVTVHIQRRPPEALFGIRTLLTSAVAAIALVIACAVLVLFVCTSQKGVKLLGWTKKRRRRTESCENIEMTFNASGKRLDNGAGPKPYGENGISVVGQSQKNNRYRSVPSDDEASLDEETGLGGLLGSDRQAVAAAAASAVAATAATAQRHRSGNGAGNGVHQDVHVPRLIDFCDQIPTSANASSLDGCPFDPNKSEYSSPSKTPILLYTKPNWSQHQHHRQQHQQLAAELNHSSNDSSAYASFERRTSSRLPLSNAVAKAGNNCDTDSTYPDLLDISSLSLNPKLRVHTPAAHAASPAPSHTSMATPPLTLAAATAVASSSPATTTTSCTDASELPFSTYPRQKPSPARTKTAALAAAAAAAQFSDSQSFLLADSNTHLLSNLSISMKHQHKHPVKHPQAPLQRHSLYNNAPTTSASTIATTPQTAKSIVADDNHRSAALNSPSSSLLLDFGQSYQHHHSKVAAAAAAVAGLINNNPLTSGTANAAGGLLDCSPSSPPAVVAAASSILATAQAYDYHAAQLERFLEEYRNLQQQLCRMKETCDSIRQKEAPVHRLDERLSGVGRSAQSADPAMYSGHEATAAAAVAAIGGSVSGVGGIGSMVGAAGSSGLPLDASGSPNHKVMMRKTVVNPRQPPDPPPYWLHRTAILKRLQANGGGSAEAAAPTVIGTGGSSTTATATAALAASDNGNDMKAYYQPQS